MSDADIWDQVDDNELYSCNYYMHADGVWYFGKED